MGGMGGGGRGGELTRGGAKAELMSSARYDVLNQVREVNGERL